MSSSVYRRLHGLFTTTTTTTTSTTTYGSLLAKPSRQPSSVTSIPKTPKPKPTTTATSPSDSSVSPLEKLKKLVKKFKRSCRSHEFRRRSSAYETTVRRLAAEKQFSLVEDILEHQKKYDSITNEYFVVRLIGLYGEAGMFDHAYKLFDEMPQLKCERTVLSFNALLAACVNSKKFEKIGDILRESPDKLSIKPNSVSYNTVIKAFCEMGSLDSAQLVVNEMEKVGLEPNQITFNTLLDAFYRNNMFSDAEKVWELMESKGIVPNARSYNPKLRALVTANRITEAVGMIGEMKSKGVDPDIYSFNALIKGFRDTGDLDEAKRLYDELVKSGCRPDKVTISLLLTCACYSSDFDFGLQLCKEAISRRLVIGTDKVQRVVDGLFKELKVQEAEELVALATTHEYLGNRVKLPVTSVID